MTKEQISNACGYAGIAFIQGATMPSIIATIAGDATAKLPPLSMVLLVWIGLSLFLYRGIERKDMVAIVSNSIGFLLNSVLLAIIVYR